MYPNPDHPPAAANVDAPVDRASRTALADKIRQFLDDRTSAFEFDDALVAFRSSSDPTVRFVAHTVWYHYDDCDDHLVTLSKPEWGYFQRLLLLLESDCQVALTPVRRWSWTQLVAVGCLIAFGWCVWRLGWGEHVLVCSIPFGFVSMFISYIRHRNRIPAVYGEILAPFSSFAQLRAAYRATAGFTKKRFPRALAKRRIRSRVAEFGLRLQMYAGWLLLSPIPLLIQTFPLTETRTEVKTV